MIEGTPSRTALAAATHRAVHQVIEAGRVFPDPLALRILQADEAALRADADAHPERRGMRLFIAARHRLAEDLAAAAAARGTRQIVILGAGLDTHAYRSPHSAAVIHYEVDHPATGAWKQQCLGHAGLVAPPTLRFVAIDFERQSLAGQLAAAGFDAAAPSIFIWLGVVPYLSEAAIFATLSFIASLPGGAEIVFDYGDPPDTLAPELRAALQARAAQVEALGEPWLTHFEPEPLAERLRAIGFADVRDHQPAQVVAHHLGLPLPPPARGGHILHAATRPYG